MENKKHNVFVLSTEYQFILAISIIEEFFSNGDFTNQLVLKGPRSSDVNTQNLPEHVTFVKILFEDEDLESRIKKEIFNKEINNLFVVHTYRAYETYVLSLAPKSTRIHLMQDGSLFYHTMEINLFLNRIKETFLIYKKLWEKNIILKKIVLYPRHIHKSRFIKELWMTNPDLFVDPKTKLKINKVHLFPKNDTVEKCNKLFFVKKEEDYKEINDCLIYLAPIIRDRKIMPLEIDEIKKIKAKVNKKNIIIKLHPGIKDEFRLNMLKSVFGDVVIQNYIPAEMYIANSKNSCVVGSASTALFYENTKCQSFALKKYYQRIGLYATWKNVALPKHVHIIDDLEDFDKIQIR
jgi:hypothetical protein